VLLARWNNEVKRKGGYVVESSSDVNAIIKGRKKDVSHYEDHFGLSLHSMCGDSGGVIVSIDRRLVGFLSSAIEEEYYSTGVKLIKVLELIDFYKRRLKDSAK